MTQQTRAHNFVAVGGGTAATSLQHERGHAKKIKVAKGAKVALKVRCNVGSRGGRKRKTPTPAVSRHPKQQRVEKRGEGAARSSVQPLEQEIAEFAQYVRLSDAEKAHRRKAFEELRTLVTTFFPRADVQLYGSSSSGLETFRSDLDVTIGNIRPEDATFQPPGEEGEANEQANTCIAQPDGEQSIDQADKDPHGASALASEDEEPTFSLNLATSPDFDGEMNSMQLHTIATQSTGKSPWNRTDRRQKIRLLRMLQQMLNVCRPTYLVKCLNKAKIPILMVQDPESQLAIDIGINREAFDESDHGRTTSLVAQLQQKFGDVFTSLVTFLKEFLHQFDLNKPYTGGIGSFRLYVMVAHILFISPRNQPASLSLIKFFAVFGNVDKKNFLRAETSLALPLGDARSSVVDFTAVFRIEECVSYFAMAHEILVKHRTLGAIFYEDKLRPEREQVRKRIQELSRQEASGTGAGICLRDNGAPTQSRKKSKKSVRR
ncbi:TPA: hypothetical protein N0F65_006759 [Lagenidium giganteum]|uniref:Poly(A) RNA polymerase mitochondrial-like central palm domain-containing protein n=1 Tax=Lagenidium giganteum TaxID=4803 RepID=A0AAV2Z013_9STRA|nr:TPA: hypothetical protein N0F65_006759 [Lagenidium giganteum]